MNFGPRSGTPERARDIVAGLNAAMAPTRKVLRLLDRTTFDMGGVRVIGATL